MALCDREHCLTRGRRGCLVHTQYHLIAQPGSGEHAFAALSYTGGWAKVCVRRLYWYVWCARWLIFISLYDWRSNHWWTDFPHWTRTSRRCLCTEMATLSSTSMQKRSCGEPTTTRWRSRSCRTLGTIRTAGTTPKSFTRLLTTGWREYLRDEGRGPRRFRFFWCYFIYFTFLSFYKRLIGFPKALIEERVITISGRENNHRAHM